MKKISLLVFLSIFMLVSCSVSNKHILRMQKLEEGVGSPSTIEELTEAIEKYEQRVRDLQLAQTQIGIWYKMLGTRYLDNKMYGEALKCFQKALEIYPANQNLYYYVAVCAGYMSHSALDFAADGNSNSAKKKNYLHLAETAYLEAIRLENRYARALYGLGVLYVYELDENEKAIPYLETLLSIEKKHTDGMFVLARAYYSTYQFEKAIALYDKIIEVSTSPEKKADAAANKKQVLDASYVR